MLLPVKGEAGAADASQWDRLSFSLRNPSHLFPSFPRGRPLCPPRPLCPCSGTWLVPDESCPHSSPSVAAITDPCHQHCHSQRACPRLGLATRLGHLETQSCLCICPLAQPAHQLGSPQRKLTVSPHQCTALFHGHVVEPACSLPASPHSCALPRQPPFKISPSLHPTPSPKYTTEDYRVGGFFFPFLSRNKRLAFLPFCCPILGLNLADGKRVEAVKRTRFVTRSTLLGPEVPSLALSVAMVLGGGN